MSAVMTPGLTPAQLEARAVRLGGSDVAAVLGLDKYRTPLEVFLEKATALGTYKPEGDYEREDISDADHIVAGHIMEEPIAQMYVRHEEKAGRGGFKLTEPRAPYLNDKFPWLVANIDRERDNPMGVECKNVHWALGGDWGEDGTDEVAEYYMLQPVTYMIVTGWQRWDVAAYFGSADIRVYPLEYDKELAQLVIDQTHDFWHDHVLKGEPPEPDCTHSTTAGLLQRLHGVSGDTVHLPPAAEHWHQVAQDATQQAKHYQNVVDGAKNHIRHLMGDAALGMLPDGTGYKRSIVKRRGFTVDPTEYQTLRHTKKP
ncbi:MAG: YqaJ viral recombinase family protein [Pseudomonadota bacterium]